MLREQSMKFQNHFRAALPANSQDGLQRIYLVSIHTHTMNAESYAKFLFLAQALATPIRQCSAHMTSFPSFFLQDFELMSHPTTGQIYRMPRSLASRHKYQSSKDKDPSLPW